MGYWDGGPSRPPSLFIKCMQTAEDESTVSPAAAAALIPDELYWI